MGKRQWWICGLGLVVVAAYATPGWAGWPEVLKEYKKQGKSRDEGERAEILLDFEGHENPEAVQILLKHLFSDKSERVLQAAVKVLMAYKTDATAATLCARAMKGGGDKTRFRYLLLVIGRMENPKVVPTLLHFCKATNLRHVVLSIEGLGKQRVGMPEVINQLKAFTAEDQEFVYRISALSALAQIPDKAVIPILIDGLKTPGRIAEVAARGLLLLTGKRKGLSHREWKLWWQENGKDFKLDPEAIKEKKLEETRLDKREKGSEFYGIEIYAKRLLFVLDKSGSMLVGKPRSRWDGLKSELTRLIQDLSEDVKFNIIFFDDKVDRWRSSKLHPATPKNKESAIEYIEKIKIDPRGMTRTDEAMEEAFRKFVKKKEVETIFLLTDGLPTRLVKDKKTKQKRPEGIPLDKVYRQILSDNRYEKVRINTIGCFTEGGAGQKMPDPLRENLRKFLEAIAKAHDGRFLEVK